MSAPCLRLIAPRAAAMWLGGCLLWLSAAGCASVPRIDPTGEHIFVPGGAAPVAAPLAPPPTGPVADPVALTVTVNPSQVVAPVGSEVVLIASVGTEGFLLTHQRVEWMISPESVGQFLSPGQRRFFDLYDYAHGLPKKVDGRYAINTTLFYPLTLDRGTPTPFDDIALQSGQSWVSVTSPSEGTSVVTVFAPQVRAWDRRQQTATIFWVDAQWRFPPPAITPLGNRNSLTTVVTRQSTGSPLPGWVVRYEIAGGPDAGFAPDGAPSIEVVTNEAGEATVEIFEKQEVAGTNQVNIQVVRPSSVAGQSRPAAVGSGSMLQTWGTGPAVPTVPPVVGGTAPPANPAPPPATPPPAAGEAQLDVTIQGPTTATVGSPVQFDIQVTNRGNAPARRLLVTDRFDAGLQHAASASPIERDLIDLQPGGAVRLTVNFQVTQAGEHCQDVEVRGDGGLSATAKSCLTAQERTPTQPTTGDSTPEQPNEPQAPGGAASSAGVNLSVRAEGAARRRVGEKVKFTIEVTNGGSQRIENLTVAADFASSLEPEQASQGNEWLEGNALGWKVASLEAGGMLKREIELRTLREAPRACNRVTLTADNLQSLSDEACLEIVGDPSGSGTTPSEAPIVVSIADTADPIKVGEETTYQVVVENKSGQSLFNVGVTATLSDQIALRGMSGPVQGSPMGRAIRFAPIRELRAGEAPLSFELRVKAVQAGTARLHAEVVSQGQARAVTGEQTTEVLP